MLQQLAAATKSGTSLWSLDAYAAPVEDEHRQWKNAKWVIRDFVALARSDPEESAAALGLYPTVELVRLDIPRGRYYVAVLPEDRSSSGGNFHVRATAIASGR